MAARDFNHYGKLDVAVAAYGTLPGGSTSDPGAVQVLIGNGGGIFPKTLAASGHSFPGAWLILILLPAVTAYAVVNQLTVFIALTRTPPLLPLP